MFSKKLGSLVLGLSFAATSLSALSGPLNTIDGITWDPEGLIDFTAAGVLYSTQATAVGSELKGYGDFSTINGSASGPNELTMVFEGIMVTSLDLAGNFETSGGVVRFYSDPLDDFSFDDEATAANGSLFLELSFVDEVSGVVAKLNQDGLGSGSLEVTGGSAAQAFDTDFFAALADLEFTFSSNLLPNGVALNGGVHNIFGTFEVKGDTVHILEPSSTALMALGFIGMMGVGRFTQKNRKNT